jgi:hypothetical protein
MGPPGLEPGTNGFSVDRGRLGGVAHDLVAALGEIDCETTLVPTRHPVVDIAR